MDSLPPSQPASESIARSARPRHNRPAAQTLHASARLTATFATVVVMLLFAAPALTAWGDNTPPANNLRNPQAPAHRAAKIKYLEKKSGCPAQFITAMLAGPRGGLWVASEDSGIFYRGPKSHHWANFNTSNAPGLASNRIYSLCIDHQGVLLAGTLRHGVCAYNGHTWQHYGILTGPLGSHIVAIANNPRNNSVWMCSESGISIYSTTHHTWRYLTRMSGLPANPDCIAFSAKGTAFVGTLCDGLAISPYPYKHWRIVTGPCRLPRTPFGNGLPSNLINCLLVGHRGTLYVGTDLGLAISHNNGESFRYERGRDYAAKVKGLWHPPSHFPKPPKTLLNRLLPGDHVTCLARGRAGNLWLGIWRDGYARINIRTGAILQSRLTPGLAQLDCDIARLVPLADGTLAIGRYRSGVSILKMPPEKLAASHGNSRRRSPIAIRQRIARPLVGNPLPRPAGPPTRRQLTRLNRRAIALLRVPTSHAARIVSLPSDWLSEGNWLDRYGHYASICCTMDGNGFDQVGGQHDDAITYRSWIGPHCGRGDRLRYWVQWNRSGQKRVLQDPDRGGRKQSEWDDHGETYPVVQTGHGDFCTLHLHAGVFVISAYLVNKDGHSGDSWQRDYTVTLADRYMPDGLFVALGQSRAAARSAYQRLAHARPVAHGRVANFWWGVHVRFIARLPRPGCLTLAVHRNFSFNTILSGVFVDAIRPDIQHTVTHPAPVVMPMPAFLRGLTKPTAKSATQKAAKSAPLPGQKTAVKLLNHLLALRNKHPIRYMAALPQFLPPLLRYSLTGKTVGHVNTRRRASREDGPGNSGGFHHLRRGLALLARDDALFSLAGGIYPQGKDYELFAWIGRTDAGSQGDKNWQWGWPAYGKFMARLKRQMLAVR